MGGGGPKLRLQTMRTLLRQIEMGDEQDACYVRTVDESRKGKLRVLIRL